MKTANKYFFLLLWPVYILFSCHQELPEQTDKVVARVFNRTLTLSELASELPSNSTGKDSSVYAREYIEKWIKQQLLVAEAEKRLTPEELRIEREIEKYRQELIIYKYKNKRFNEIISRTIPEKEILDFYHKNLELYQLNEAIVRVNYIIFPRELQIPESILTSLKRNQEKDVAVYEDFVFRFAKKYDNFDNQWIYFNYLLQQIKHSIDQPELFLKKNNMIDLIRQEERHIIVINDYYVSGEHAPVGFVRSQIKGTIINREKLDFLREIKDSLYDDALKYNKFRVFNQ
ncbi:MAG TPA: hypothetical protein PLK12_10645 [Prolixibacteraceae bacterium]|nr:hypothetical protein [Prolixibacteraceae bacterium]